MKNHVNLSLAISKESRKLINRELGQINKVAMIYAILLMILSVPNSLFATNPISSEAYMVTELSKENDENRTNKTNILSTMKSKLQFLKTKIVAAFKNASKLSKIAFIVSATSVLFFLLIYSPISNLFFIFGSLVLAIIGLVFGITALFHKKSRTEENKKISKRLSWASIIMPFLTSIAFYISLLFFWYL